VILGNDNDVVSVVVVTLLAAVVPAQQARKSGKRRMNGVMRLMS
jgi:hypothetical protein